LAQIQRVSVTGQAAVAGQESGQRHCSSALNSSSRVASAELVEKGTSTLEPP
jgi:hypothetical protein